LSLAIRSIHATTAGSTGGRPGRFGLRPVLAPHRITGVIVDVAGGAVLA
jgi:hypothetical protein